jgi:hypothetical protein
MATIKIKRVITEEDNRYRMQVWVTETSDNIPSELFLFARIPPVPSRPLPEDGFQRTCRYSDILLYPATTPETSSPFFRKPGVDLIFTSLKELSDYFTTYIYDMVQLLVEDIVGANTAAVVETNVPLGS